MSFRSGSSLPKFSSHSSVDIDVENLLYAQRLRAQTLATSHARQARRHKAMSDDSDDDSLARTMPAGPDQILTPNGSTPADDSDQKSKPEKLDPDLVGMSVGLKNLYSGTEDRKGRFQWQATIPEDVIKPAEDAETAKWALIVRHVKVYNDPTKVLSIHSIVVQSPFLKDLLETVLDGYPGVTVTLARLEFSGTFEPLIHRWNELKTAIAKLRSSQTVIRSGEDDPATMATADSPTSEMSLRLQHAELLYDVLETEFQTLINSSQDMKAKGVMTYEHLWTLFQPGSLAYSRQEGQDRVFTLRTARYGFDRDSNPVLWLTLEYIDFDGTRFGTKKLKVHIHAYSGTRKITSLSTYPFEFHDNMEELKSTLVKRGAKVESFAGSHYKAYEGIGWRLNPQSGAKDKITLRGRIVIDTYGWNRFNPNEAVFVAPLEKDADDDSELFPRTRANPDSMYEDLDEIMDGMPFDGHFEDEDPTSKLEPLTADQKLICTHTLRGYALKEKLWLNLFINSVKDINFNSRAFESLVLPESQKELVLGFAASQRSSRHAFDDVIEGKGRGIIILLCGPPGVGKTLTAESVAEEMKVPLYMMSAGDLGLDSRHIEARLSGIFDIVTRWNAILLLDEADVFLEERSLHELERNKLVSIFLRVLEYYEGIMFLTTNRVQTFDQAFQSRIHISLDYPELSIDSRKTVWRNFLTQHDVVLAGLRKGPSAESASSETSNFGVDSVSRPASDSTAIPNIDGPIESVDTGHTITDLQISQLAQMQMNGRQIKNVLKTAQLLASRRGERLAKDHITKVLAVTQHLHNATRENERTRSSIFS